MNARASVARACLLVCVVGLISHQMHRRLLVSKKRPSPNVVILARKEPTTAVVVRYSDATSPAWFRADPGVGRAAYGAHVPTHTDVECRAPYTDTWRALMQAARCFPYAQAFVHAEASASAEDVAKALNATRGTVRACQKVGPLLMLVPRATLERCVAASDCLVACNATPQLCVALTFPTLRHKEDPLKRLAHQNTARMYAALGPRVRALVAVAAQFNESAEEGLEPLPSAPATNAHGTPLLSSLLERARDACPQTPLVGYANADILFDGGLLSTLDALLKWEAPAFLAVGRRRNHPLRGALSLDNVSAVDSELFLEVAQDYFFMPRGVVDTLSATLPPYVIGRRAYDNALNDWAFHRSFLVDLTETVTALHQTTADGNYAGHSTRNPDVEYNVQLPGAAYDHGATSHAQYATVRVHGDAVAVQRKSDGAWMTPPGHTVVWLSHPETDCISGSPIVSCGAFAQGDLSSLLDRDEAAMSLREWPSAPIEGPSFVHANGDVTVCKTRLRYAGGGCGAPAVVGDDAPCPSPDTTVASVVVATQFWGEGYFHMVVEGFARIAQAQTEHPAFFRERTVHAHSPSPQAGPLAKLLGLAVVSGNVLATHGLLAPPPTPCGGHRRSPHARWLCALLWPVVVPRSSSSHVLVVRRDGTARSILNHDALVARLNAQVHTGQEPVLEQLRLFAGAHTVVAPHGAELANAVAMAAGGHMVELQTAPFNHCYLLWALNLDLNYYGHYEPGATHHGAWTVDLERLRALPVFSKI